MSRLDWDLLPRIVRVVSHDRGVQRLLPDAGVFLCAMCLGFQDLLSPVQQVFVIIPIGVS